MVQAFLLRLESQVARKPGPVESWGFEHRTGTKRLPSISLPQGQNYFLRLRLHQCPRRKGPGKRRAIRELSPGKERAAAHDVTGHGRPGRLREPRGGLRRTVEVQRDVARVMNRQTPPNATRSRGPTDSPFQKLLGAATPDGGVGRRARGGSGGGGGGREAPVAMAAGGGVGREPRSATVPAGPAAASRLPSPAARCAAARWLLRTEARLVSLQKFPPGRRRSG